jgi:F-type H+-transporting ATPase subunit epsilon
MKLKIVTPEKLIKEVEVTSVTLPSQDGQITILPKHHAILAGLEEGIVTYVADGNQHDFAIGSGYAQTDGSVIMILVSRAYGQNEIDKKLTDEAIQKAKKILSETNNFIERENARAILRRSIVDSKLIIRHRKRTV